MTTKLERNKDIQIFAERLRGEGVSFQGIADAVYKKFGQRISKVAVMNHFKKVGTITANVIAGSKNILTKAEDRAQITLAKLEELNLIVSEIIKRNRGSDDEMTLKAVKEVKSLINTQYDLIENIATLVKASNKSEKKGINNIEIARMLPQILDYLESKGYIKRLKELPVAFKTMSETKMEGELDEQEGELESKGTEIS